MVKHGKKKPEALLGSNLNQSAESVLHRAEGVSNSKGHTGADNESGAGLDTSAAFVSGPPLHLGKILPSPPRL